MPEARTPEAIPDIVDVLVVGGGPAGSIAALEAARRGMSVVLVDRSTFPRHKVCGCCLSAAGVDLLRELDLESRLMRFAASTHTLELWNDGRHAVTPLSPGMAISRADLDEHLLAAAADAGACVLTGRSFVLAGRDAGGIVAVSREGAAIRARAAVVADGLGGSFLRNEPEFAWIEHRAARVGLGAIIPPGDEHTPALGVIRMCLASAGYVGLVALPDGSTDIAAAVDEDALRAAGSPAAIVASILAASGASGPDPAALAWRGTPRLTRRRRCVQSRRIFLVGDAAGYVEPFTGEGMTWAIASGRAVASHVEAHVRGHSAAVSWTSAHAALLSSRQNACRAMTLLLRSAPARRVMVSAARAVPLAASAAARWTARPFPRAVRP